MSLILDALNRADKERSVSPQTANLHPSPTPPPVQSGRVWRWILEGAIVAGLLGIVIYLVYFQPAPAANTATVPVAQAPATAEGNTTAAEAPVATLPSTTPVPAPTPSQTPTKPAAVTPPEQPAPLSATPPAIASSATTGDAEKTAAKPTDDAIAALYKQNSSATTQPKATPAPTQTSRTAPTVKQKPVREKPIGLDIFKQVPLLSALPERFQATVPNIEYSVHVYNDKGNSGMVNLNGAIRHIGDSVAPGLSVVAILPDGVVLDYRGTQFRLRALNSWVNFK